MAHKSQVQLDKLLKRLKVSNPILLTGAGFSYGAKNGNNEILPLGNNLKSILLKELLGYDDTMQEYQDWIKETLANVYQYCEHESTPERVADFLRETFSECEPEAYHSIIANFPWKKVYTLNIDDLFENAAKKGSLAVQNQNRKVIYHTDKKIEYIKLHGCVNNPSLGFIFSRDSYIDSMASGGDYRMLNLCIDLQSEDFVLIGTEMDEIDIDFFLALQKRGEKSRNGGLFFVNPNPSKAFIFKAETSGADIIEMTCEEFANWLNSIKLKAENNSKSLYFQYNFRNVSKYLETRKKLNYTDSKLYFGFSPLWEDIIFDWDFKSDVVKNIFQDIKALEEANNEPIVISIVSKLLSGKSVFLKRLAFLLHTDGWDVYEYIGKEFNYKSFISSISDSSIDNIVLMIESGSSYYLPIAKLICEFPKDKKLIVLCTDRPFFHYKKRYCLIPFTNFKEYDLLQLLDHHKTQLAKSIITTLDKKGYLGELKALSDEEKIKYINKINDISSIVYNLTEGSNFKKRYIKLLHKLINENDDVLDVLILLSIFQTLDLPYFPLELLSLWKGIKTDIILKKIDDFIKFENTDGISLRSTIVTNEIIHNSSFNRLNKIIKDLLILISPNIANNINYWNDIQSKVMKVNLLHSKLKIGYEKIKEILKKIKSYYNDDVYYWIQLGIVEQKLGEYDRALNHFKQAEVLRPDYYLVKNALARNYLRMANSSSNIEIAKNLFEEGEKRMLELIRKRDDYQVKAYSTHSYIHELIIFWDKFKIMPNKKEIEKIMNLLNAVMEKNKNDYMTQKVSLEFYSFIKRRNLKEFLPSFKMENIGLLRQYFTSEEIEMLDDMELE